MWNKFVDILKEPATKRLGLAIVISASLHAIFFGNMDFSLPTLKKEMHLIEARIQMPKVVPQNSIPPPETVAMTEPEQIIKTLPEANIAEPSDVVAPEAKSEAAVSDAVEAVLKPEPIAAESIVPPQMNAEPESIDQVQPEDIGLVINENAYQYIET